MGKTKYNKLENIQRHSRFFFLKENIYFLKMILLNFIERDVLNIEGMYKVKVFCG